MTLVQGATNPGEVGAASAGSNLRPAIGASSGTVVVGATCFTEVPPSLATTVESSTHADGVPTASHVTPENLRPSAAAADDVLVHEISRRISQEYPPPIPGGGDVASGGDRARREIVHKPAPGRRRDASTARRPGGMNRHEFLRKFS